MDALPAPRKRQKFIGAPVANMIPPQWRSSPRPIRSNISNGIFLCSLTSRRGSLLARVNGMCLSRNHFAALLVARQLSEATGEPVTVVNLDGYKARRLLWELKFPEDKIRLIEEEKSYPDYLRLVARHKLVLQLDRSHVPGQVAGDALLTRTVCVGGDGAIERIAFPKTCGEGREINEIASIALDLLRNAESRAAIVAESQELALERLSFQAVRLQLANFSAQLNAR